VKLLSVNVSLPKEVVYEGEVVHTGIFKEPVAGPVQARFAGLEGDGQGDTQNHGGSFKTVYAYPFEHYPHWEGILKRRPLPYGQFGENLTTEGLLEDQAHIGALYRVGTCLLQVTQPRKPCFKLGLRVGMAKFVRIFWHSGRMGIYMRVAEEGALSAGDPIELVEDAPENPTVRRLWELAYFEEECTAEAQQALRLPHLSPEWRRPLTQRLRKAGIAIAAGR
jgi:MOSC domain-containing protein YiiM